MSERTGEVLETKENEVYCVEDAKEFTKTECGLRCFVIVDELYGLQQINPVTV